MKKAVWKKDRKKSWKKDRKTKTNRQLARKFAVARKFWGPLLIASALAVSVGSCAGDNGNGSGSGSGASGANSGAGSGDGSSGGDGDGANSGSGTNSGNGSGSGSATSLGSITAVQSMQSTQALTGTVALTWVDAADANVAHIRITWLPEGGTTTQPLEVAKGTQMARIEGLSRGKTYEFAYKAVDKMGNASNARSLARAVFPALPGVVWREAMASGELPNELVSGLRDVLYVPSIGIGVAVGRSGHIITSSDLRNWRKRGSPVDDTLQALAYGGGTFIAVGDSGTILSSIDKGKSWTKRVSGISDPLYGVAYGSGWFLTVGAKGGAARSANGLTGWSKFKLELTASQSIVADLNDIEFFRYHDQREPVVGNRDKNLFAVVGNGGKAYVCSHVSGAPGNRLAKNARDQQCWVENRTNTSSDLHSVAFGVGANAHYGHNIDSFAIVGPANYFGARWAWELENAAIRSYVTSGLKSPGTTIWRGVSSKYNAVNADSFANRHTSLQQRFVFVGDNRARRLWWDDGNPPVLREFASTVSSESSLKLYGVDGISTTADASGQDGMIDFVAVGGKTVSGSAAGAVYTSSDAAVEWSESTVGNLHLNSAASNGIDTTVAVGNSGAIYRSTSTSTSTNTGTSTRTSTNSGDNWQPVASDFTQNLRGIAYGKVSGQGLYVAVGDDGAIRTSSNNGSTWITRVAKHSSGVSVSEDLYAVHFANDSFIAVGEHARILKSSNGSSWLIVSGNMGTSAMPAMAAMGTSLNGIATSGAVGSKTFVAVGANGRVETSVDNGNTWQTQSAITDMQGGRPKLNAVVYAESRFVAVGDDGVIFTSVTGNTWTQQTSPTMAHLFDIAYGSHSFVAVGANGERVQSFTPAAEGSRKWALLPKRGGIHLNGISYGNDTFIAVGDTKAADAGSGVGGRTATILFSR